MGKNNEGKSNVLRALNTVLNALNYSCIKLAISKYGLREIGYSVEKDFPINLLGHKNTIKRTTLEVSFKLDENEVIKLNNQFPSKTTTDGCITYSINIDRNENIEIKVYINNGNQRRLTSNKNISIALSFLCTQLRYDFIPSVRTDRVSIDIVEKLMSENLKLVEQSEEYQQAISKVNELYDNKMKELSSSITQKIHVFLPNISSCNISSSRELKMRALRSAYEIYIDDGIKTDLNAKGDGVKSLVALAMLQSDVEEFSGYILMIDEPEAHLHSSSILELRKTLKEISRDKTVIVTTHHPLFVDRSNVKNNYILEKGVIIPAKSIKDIKQLLGVTVSENLIGFELVNLFEGETDRESFIKFIRIKKSPLLDLYDSGLLGLHSMKGLKQLESYVTGYYQYAVEFNVLIDNDSEANLQVRQLLKKGLINESNITKIYVQEKQNCELEDLYVDEITNQAIN